MRTSNSKVKNIILPVTATLVCIFWVIQTTARNTESGEEYGTNRTTGNTLVAKSVLDKAGPIVENIRTFCSSKGGGLVRNNPEPEIYSHKEGGMDQKIPYVISPRYTWLLDDTPNLLWNNVDTEQYEVCIFKQTFNGVKAHWDETHIAKINTLDYPQSEKPLRQNDRYMLVVRAANGLMSTQDLGHHYGFSVETNNIRECVAEGLKNELEAIEGSDSKALIQAQVKADLLFFSEAITEFEKLPVESNVILADLLAVVGRGDHAFSAYKPIATDQDRVSKSMTNIKHLNEGLSLDPWDGKGSEINNNLCDIKLRIKKILVP